MKFASAYQNHKKSPIVFHDEEGNHDGRTEQHHKDLVDIHKIIHTYDKTGIIQHVSKAKAEYGDFTMINEYQEALNTVIRSQDAFDALPAKVRQRFGNDPGQFLEFITNPENATEAVKLGLAEEKDISQPIQKVEVVNAEKPSETAQ
jgi:phage internal scaffolding protein